MTATEAGILLTMAIFGIAVAFIVRLIGKYID